MQRALVSSVVLAGVLAACRCGPEPVRGPPEALRAVVEAQEGLELLESREGFWRRVSSLPARARAFRASPDGRHLAWIEDTTLNGVVSMEGRLRLDGKPDEPLGALSLREHEAFGLAVDDAGRALFLGPKGLVRRRETEVRDKATEPVCGAGGCAWVEDGCLVTAVALRERVCGDALRPLDVKAGRVLARTNASVVLADATSVTTVPMTDVLEGRLGPARTWLLVRRVQEGGRVQDVLLVGPAGAAPTEVLRADVVAQARFLGSGRIVAIRAAGEAMDNLLAHAPEEFGGEAVAGEAVVVQPATRQVAVVPGLEGRKVRALIPLNP